MAELTVFRFHSGSTFFHHRDARFKLLFVLLVSMASLRGAYPGLLMINVLLLGGLRMMRVPFGQLVYQCRYLGILLVGVWGARAVAVDGETLFRFWGICVTREGVLQGGEVCLRLILVMLLGLNFIASTRPKDIQRAIIWGMAPIPFIDHNRVAIMLSLLMRFIPMIFDQALKTSDAERARCVEQRKNPVYRLMKFTIPFLKRTFEDADRLVMAMEARCYHENRPLPVFTAGRADWMSLIVVGAICLGVVYF